MRVAMLRGKIQYGEAPVLGGHRLAINRCTRHTPPNDEPLVLEPLARNLEGPSSHLKRKMSNILPSRPLVGRAHELEVLGKALAAAQDGTGAAVFLKGDTGTGKSRLASAVVEEGNRLGFDTVSGQAYRMDSGVPYGLWSNAFFPRLRDMDDATLSVLKRFPPASAS